MAATDARPVPRKNAAFRYPFAIRKSDGTLVTGWAGADSEVSIDQGAFADCANEATEIGSSGCGYIDLTAAEMNGDSVMLKVTVTNTDALPVVVTFFPEEAGDYRVNVSQFGGTSVTGRDIGASVLLSPGTGTGQISLASGAVTAGTVSDKAGYSLSQSFPSNFASLAITAGGAVTVGTLPSIPAGWITAAGIATGAIDADAVAADAVTAIQDGLATAGDLAGLATQADVGAVGAYLASKAAGAPGFGTWGTYDPATDSLEAADEAGKAAADLLGTPDGATLADDLATANASLTTLTTRIPGTVQPQTGDAYARLGAPAGASHAADVAAVKADTAAIKLKTDNLPADPAGVADLPDVSGLATATALDAVASDVTAIAGDVDTEVAAILSAVQPAAIRTALGLAAADLDTQLDAILAASGGTTNTPLDSGTAQGGTTTTITLKSSTSIVPDTECSIELTGGPGAGETRWVQSYNSTTKVVTFVGSLLTAPTSSTTYNVWRFGGSDLAANRAALVEAWAADVPPEENLTDVALPTNRQIMAAVRAMAVGREDSDEEAGTYVRQHKSGVTMRSFTLTKNTSTGKIKGRT